MIRTPKTLLAVLCSLAFAGAVGAAEPEDPKADPAESHHGGGDAAKHSQTLHPVEGVDAHDHDEPGSHKHDDEISRHCPMPTTGDGDNDYALRLRHYHLMEVALARGYAGQDAMLRARAQATIDEHSAAVAELDKWLANRGVNPDKYKMQCDVHSGMATGYPAGYAWGTDKFVALDVDGDGYIEHAEMTDTHPMHRHFAMIDTNGDGMLSRAEADAHHLAVARGQTAERLTAAPHPTPTEAFSMMDDNADGFLTLTELSASDMLHQHFNVADTDKDGRLTPTEVDAHIAAMGGHQH
jgi:Ca2+-binding EF-hand superfamily protein